MHTDLVIDIGNSWIKGCYYFNDIAMDSFKVRNFTPTLVGKINQRRVQSILVSNVRNINLEHLKLEAQHLIKLQHSLKLPFKNNYNSPDTLGMDRVAAVSGALQLFPARNILAITAGTCITYNLVDKNKIFHGGAISPGINMRYKALHKYTGKLPLVNHKEQEALIGTNTEESILSGVQQGVLSEMDGIIDKYKVKYDKLVVIITGGAAVFFENKLKNNIFAAPDLTTNGLYQILKLNA